MARGGGRGGGGGRSGGFGGSRGGGGRSSSGGRGGGSFGSGRSGGSWGSGGGWGGSSNSRPVFRTGPIFTSWGSNRRRRSSFGGGPSGGGGGGCSSTIAIFALIVILVAFIFPMFIGGGFGNSGGSGNSGTSITRSTVEREPLPAGSVNETDYYTDDANWVENETVLVDGLRYFYNETGVQPHVYITTEINGSSNASANQVEEYAQELYDELFTDEAHLLLLFYEGRPSDYHTYYVTGAQADQVIDREAADILLDYIDRYYYDSSLNTSEFFSKSFRDAADRIMEVTTSPWIPVFLVIGGIVLVGILFLWWRKRKENEAIEAKRTEEMLNRPIDTFGTSTSEVDDLAKKYTDDSNE